jgi:hypothetical protein
MFERFADRFWFGNGEEVNVIARPFALSGGLRRIASKPADEAWAKQSPMNRLEAFDKIIRLSEDCFVRRKPSSQ